VSLSKKRFFIPFRLQKSSSEPMSYDASSLARCSLQKARDLIPFALAEELACVPLAFTNEHSPAKKLHVLCSEKSRKDLLQILEFSLGKKVKLLKVSEALLRDTLYKAYFGEDTRLKESLDLINQKWKKGLRSSSSELLQRKSQKGSPAEFLESILRYALAQGASDLHITPSRNGIFLGIRIHGELLRHEKQIGDSHFHAALIRRIKVLAKLDVTKTSQVAEGRMELGDMQNLQHIRVSIIPSVLGEKCVFRLSTAYGVPNLQMLGLSESAMNAMRSLEKRSGLCLLSGPTGSGKTTTLYSALEYYAERGSHCISVEDPVEMTLQYSSQIELNEQSGIDYPKALSAILRQDPDVILIGEIRDSAAAKAALQIASTGHLVLSAVHADNVAEVFRRFSGLGIEPKELRPALRLVLSQKLLPRICRCKREQGCELCGYSGKKGRVLSEEVFFPSAESGKLPDDFFLREENFKELPKSEFLPFSLSIEFLKKMGYIE
jgi:type II secretory ATPase GspE/PulE/Tfp pilus assembly ATPase PilB-like protein